MRKPTTMQIKPPYLEERFPYSCQCLIILTTQLTDHSNWCEHTPHCNDQRGVANSIGRVLSCVLLELYRFDSSFL